MEGNKKIHNGAEKAIDSGTEKTIDSGTEKIIDNEAEKPINKGAEQNINDQNKPEITLEYLREVSMNVMAVRNANEMAGLTSDGGPKDNIPLDENGDIDCSKIKFDPGFIPPPLDIEKRLEQLRRSLDPNDPRYEPEYQHTNIRAIIKLYEEGKIDGTEEVYIQGGEIVSREQSFKGPTPSTSEGGMFHQYAQKASYNHGPFGNNFHGP